MKSKPIYESGVYKYLEARGVLGQPPEVIAAAKKAFWNKRKLELKKEKLRGQKAFTVHYTKAEEKRIAEAAALYAMSRTRFIQQAVLAYIGKKYLVPSNSGVEDIKVLLSLNYSSLQEIFDRNIVPAEVGAQLLQNMESLEKQVLRLLYNPKIERE